MCVTSRLLCSKVVEAPVYDDPAAEKAYREAEYKLNRNIFGRMWDWFTAYDEEEPVSFLFYLSSLELNFFVYK